MIRQVKNRAPNPVQISAEQLVRDARERHLEDMPEMPQQYIEDAEELADYQRNKRKDFEGQIMRARTQVGLWLRYAKWEADQKEYDRSRSVYERALDMDHKNEQIWLKYAEMEMKNKFVNHARNVYDRAVTLLPRMDVFWYKYAYMEELVGAVDLACQVFERWMRWEPDEAAWMAYVKFHMRQGDMDRARGILGRMVTCHPTSSAYLRYARWEEKHASHDAQAARAVYERALQSVHHDESTEELMLSFAKFEERVDEVDRARTILRFALESLQGEDAAAILAAADAHAQSATSRLKKDYLAFEKRHGTKTTIEHAILVDRRTVYSAKVEQAPRDYDAWLDWCRLEESEGTLDSARSTYDRAVQQVPESKQDKTEWRRYVYLWIHYALFEELQAKDADRTRHVYSRALACIPHRTFTFGKLWIMASHFEVRCKQLGSARKLLGRAIGMCGKESVFRAYVDLEMQLGEIDRCRAIYTKFLETMPENVRAWQAYAKLEADVGEDERARALYELAIEQPSLDMPETMWKAYIDFEANIGEYERGRQLFSRLLQRTQHAKVYCAMAKFELAAGAEGGLPAARAVFEKANDKMKSLGHKEERVLILNAWRDMEVEAGAEGNLAQVEALLPKKIKMRRAVATEQGGEGGWEEYYEYSFPDDVKKMPGLNLLENAKKWKKMMKKKEGAAAASTDGAGAGDGGGAEAEAEAEAEAGQGDDFDEAPVEDDSNELDIDDI